MSDDQALATHVPNDAVDRLDQAVLDVTARLKRLQAVATSQARQAETLRQQAAELERQLAIAEVKLAVEMMHSAGLAAQASHLMAAAIEAGTPGLSEPNPVGSGMLTDRLAEIYNAAFDGKAVELGVEDPARFREG
jgi:hypothetical protein